jgi:hypothetical protein
LEDGFDATVPAVEDVLDRGTIADWRELARHIREDPFGPHARALESVVQHVHLYGTTLLWQDYLARCRSRFGQGVASDPERGLDS